MYETELFKCTSCGAVLVIGKNEWYKNNIKCTRCGSPVEKLEENCNANELVAENEKENN